MSSSSGSGSSRKRSSSAKKSSGRKSTSAKKSGARKSSAKKRAAAKKGGQARGRQQRAQKTAKKTASAATTPLERADFSGKTVAEFRQALTSNLIRPLELVMLSRQRIEEALEAAVSRGRMTRDDARQLAQALFTIGRQQTDDVLKDLEQLLGRSRSNLEDRTGRVRKRSASAATAARKQVGGAGAAARRAADPLLAQAD